MEVVTITGVVTNVAEKRAGSVLSVAASSSATSITVEDVQEFDPDGGSLEFGAGGTSAYTVPDPDGTTLTVPALAAGHALDEAVYLYPANTERTAYILAPDQEEELEARVPFALYDRVPLGARDPDDGNAEVVQAELVDGVLTLRDVLGTAPVSDGVFIDPTTLPPPEPSDATPPAISPDATVFGGIGSLFVKWTAITNADHVDYDVHVDTASGFTPGPSNLVVTTSGTMVNIRKLTDGSPLLYPPDPPDDPTDNTYYVMVVARDADGAATTPGAEGSGQTVKVTGDDVAALTITGDNILGNTITAGELAAEIAILATFKTATTGQRVEIDPEGIRLIGQGVGGDDGPVVVELPTDDGAVASFHGHLTADQLQVTDYLTLYGSHNFVTGTLTVASSLADPNAAPILSVAPTRIDLAGGIPGGGGYAQSHGLGFDSAGGAGGATPSFLSVTCNSSKVTLWEHNLAGDLTRSASYSPTSGSAPFKRVCGVKRVGAVIYILAYQGQPTYEMSILRVRQSTLALWGMVHVTSGIGQSFPYRAGLGVDGSYITVVSTLDDDNSTTIRMKRYTDDDTDTTNASFAFHDNVDLTGLDFNGGTIGVGNPGVGDVFEGMYATSTSYFISHDKGGVHGVSEFLKSTGVFVDETGFITESQGVARDSTNDIVYSRNGDQVTQHSAWTWADASHNLKYLVYGYTWYDSTHGYNTLLSPLNAINVRPDGAAHRAYRRTRIKISVPPLPSGVDRFTLYMAHSTTQTAATSALRYQRQAGTPHYITVDSDTPTFQFDENTSGALANLLTSNTWPGATSTLQSQTAVASGGWSLTGSDHDGFPFDTLCVANSTSSPHNITTGTLTTILFNSELVDTGTMHSTSTNTNRIVAPKTGWYLVWGRAAWDVGSTGRRRIIIRKNGSTQLTADARLPIATDATTHTAGPALVSLTAGDYVDMAAIHGQGADLDINTNSGVALALAYLHS